MSDQERKELVRALRELLEVVDMSDGLTCRDLEPHEFGAVVDDATSRARKAIQLFGDAGGDLDPTPMIVAAIRNEGVPLPEDIESVVRGAYCVWRCGQ